MPGAIQAMPPHDWQQAQWQKFCHRVANKSLAHAYLLCGAEGIGAEALAIAMGQYLLCLSPLDNIACGQCRGCKLLRAGTHPDLLLVAPEEKGKQIKIDQVREIAARVDQTAQQGGRKIIILSPAEAMNINAANAILKNLEEPAGETYFFLVSHHPTRVLPTIRSRCAKVTLAMPASEQALSWLQQLGLKNAESLLDDAGGAPLLVREWHEQGLDAELQAISRGLIDIGDARLEPMSFAKQFAKSDPFLVIRQMLGAVERLLSAKIADKPVNDASKPLLRICSQCRPELLFRLRDRLCERKAQLLASPNLNPALVIEELALDWAAILSAS